ncbi:P-loop containing nucleoside triphosphate hydrolase protein [Ampelomyces quisqualis]|uniref:P-loop containing nucleoside triphosphate hydrolase protein n=1 Tax=Ampelomyces quisqualis TaxID=50730 RepID=A0A6A5QNQ4_AMPQU|nr:P-loop containing nucleoside triphosphate hydrolase protein [Ampelomyces quisqualis]
MDTPPPPSPTEVDPFTTDSLKKLQSTDERRLLDVVDKLRRTGLNGTIELPQLVITEIPFPRKAGLCTRFATEIVLRRQPTASVTIKINPSKLRASSEQAKLSAFGRTITDLGELPDVIEEAERQMGLGKIGESAAFSRDILSVEISGPDRPQLTLVDLPGLIHSATKSSTEADKELIFGLVQEYMKNPRTIILAVVSAKNDAANQIILSLFKKIDHKGSRTLGIITKPDCLSAGDEQFWLDLALNKEVFLQRGWHMIKNRSESEMEYTFAERNAAEQSFFEKGSFKDLPRQAVGIEALRERLSTLLHRHLVQELPSLKEEMKSKLAATTTELQGLGERRETPQEQKMLLTVICHEINQILRDAVNGAYLHSFFEEFDIDAPIIEGPNVRRFRAAIQELNHSFAENIRLRGQKYKAKDTGAKSSYVRKSDKEEDSDDSDEAEDSDSSDEAGSTDGENAADDADDLLPEPKELTPDEFLDWVKKVMIRCRGHELPGSVNPGVTSHLFWEQSEPWKDFAEYHIEQVRRACQLFLHQVLEYVAPAEFRKPLAELVVNGVFDDTFNDAKQELRKLLQDKKHHPSTYNHYYTDNVQKRRREKYEAFTRQARKTATGKQVNLFSKGTGEISLNPNLFQKEMLKAVQQDMAVFAAEETLESARAYYKDEMKYFVHAVTKQVIERCMVDPLCDRILSPKVVQAMTDEEIAFVAAEPPETVSQRAFLEERKQMLEKGFEIFREAMGGVKKRGKNGK